MAYRGPEGLMKEMVRSLRFPGKISKSEEKENIFYKSLHREYRIHTKKENQIHTGLPCSVMRTGNHAAVCEAAQWKGLAVIGSVTFQGKRKIFCTFKDMENITPCALSKKIILFYHLSLWLSSIICLSIYLSF